MHHLWEQFVFENVCALATVPSCDKRTELDIESWTAVRDDTIMKMFLRCVISNAVDCSQDGEFFDHCPLNKSELKQVAGLLFSD